MSNQQNAYLKAMGIDVWVERTLPKSLLPEISDRVESDVQQAEPKSIPGS